MPAKPGTLQKRKACLFCHWKEDLQDNSEMSDDSIEIKQASHLNSCCWDLKKQKWEQRLCTLDRTSKSFRKDRAFLIYKSRNTHKDVTYVVQSHKPPNSELGIKTRLSVEALSNSLYLRLGLRRLRLRLWGTREISGSLMKMTWESQPGKLGAGNPCMIWLKEVTDVQDIKGRYFLS